MAAERFVVTYRVTPDDARSIEAHAKDICLEETVEIPEDAVPASHWEQGIVGIVESIDERPGQPSDYDVRISYRADIANNEIPNLLNVLFGNISIRRGIKIIDIQFTDQQIASFGGPRFGVDGLRKALNVYGRPLATTAIKPLGLSAKELARLCGGYALGGLDVIKDDHGLIDQHFHPFEERVSRIQDAIRDANAKTGRITHYYPMLAGRFDGIEKQAAFAKAQGCFGVLIAPLLIGPDTGFYLARKYDLAVAECQDLAEALRGSMKGLKPAFPSPAGGMTIEKINAMVDAYGHDTALLIGGALLRYSSDPEVSARAFVSALEHAVKSKRNQVQ